MKLLKSLILFAGCVAFVSCNSESKSSSNDSKEPQGKVAKYLASLDYDYSKMLATDDVLKHVKIEDPSQLEVELSDHKAMGAPEYGECSYQWPSDRPGVKIQPQFPEQPDLNTIRISNLSFERGDLKTVRSRFETGYRPMSKEEIDSANARLEKSFKDKPAAELETAKGFIKARAKSKYQHVEGIGDSAYWRPTGMMDLYLGSELIVLAGNAKFTVTAKVSSDDQENLEVAKKMAKAVIEKAK